MKLFSRLLIFWGWYKTLIKVHTIFIVEFKVKLPRPTFAILILFHFKLARSSSFYPWNRRFFKIYGSIIFLVLLLCLFVESKPVWSIQKCIQNPVKYLAKVEMFEKTVNAFKIKPLTIFAKSSILDLWQGSGYTSAIIKFILNDEKNMTWKCLTMSWWILSA